VYDSEVKLGTRRPLPSLQEIQKQIGLVGRSAALSRILRTVEHVAASSISVLIHGESGTGKELIAKAIHEFSERRDRPFVVVNAGAIPSGIIESELFGHEKGAFTGAVGTRKGYFEAADSGTIFLDEIGEMPLEAQVRLLRTLEGKEVLRVGGNVTRKIDVRVVAATNKDLAKAVNQNEFREDLYYRLNAIKIQIPALRERREDIPLLVNYFANRFCAENKAGFAGFTPEAMQILSEYNWPGNIRELKNLVESAIIVERGQAIDHHLIRNHLPLTPVTIDRNLPVPVQRSNEDLERELIYRLLLELKTEVAQLREAVLGNYLMPSRRLPARVPLDLTRNESMAEEVKPDEHNGSEEPFPSLEQMEKELIYRALEISAGNKRKSAELLLISERTLYRKIKEYNLPF